MREIFAKWRIFAIPAGRTRTATVFGVSGKADDDDLVAQWRGITSGVTRAQRRIDRMVKESGVPAQWFAVLHSLLLAPEHRLPMNALARDLSMTSGGFTKLADRMAVEGLIDRRSSAEDRRVVNARLTAKGLRTAEQATRRHLDALTECLLDVVGSKRLAEAAATLQELGDAHADAAIVEEAAPHPEPKRRDPALPDRRGRGRSRD
jgi:DNA-binding MarR family transcriptional regulator